MKYTGHLFSLGTGLIAGSLIIFSIVHPRHPSKFIINIYNASDGQVTNIIVTSKEEKVILKKIEPEENKTIALFTSEESTYTIEVTLSNGTVLSSNGGYIEPGYRVKETITETHIKHDITSYY